MKRLFMMFFVALFALLLAPVLSHSVEPGNRIVAGVTINRADISLPLSVYGINQEAVLAVVVSEQDNINEGAVPESVERVFGGKPSAGWMVNKAVPIGVHYYVVRKV